MNKTIFREQEKTVCPKYFSDYKRMAISDDIRMKKEEKNCFGMFKGRVKPMKTAL